MWGLKEFLIAIVIACALISCKKSIKPDQLPPSIQIGAEYYTQFAIKSSKGVHVTINFQMGKPVPINTKVILERITAKAIVVKTLPDLQQLTIKNAPKHTNDDIFHAFEKLFGKYPVDLSEFTIFERNQIDNGNIAKGMSKAAVIAAIGYPPHIRTPSIEDDKWTYWTSRRRNMYIYFKNGKVERIQR